MEKLPDIQKEKPKIRIPIKEVGVEGVEVPFKIESKYGGFNDTIAILSLRTDLESTVKGISMSRLLLTLNPYLELPLKHKLIRKILEEICDNVGSNNSFMKFEFKIPIKKHSPISDNSFPIYYRCRFEGQLKDKKDFRFFQGVYVQYSSYCPCSAELCRDLKEKDSVGFPHAQRSYANILIESKVNEYIWLEDIIEHVESSINTLPYPIIKRVDEQELARIAAENPIFVEDAIRAISKSLNSDSRIEDWIVKCVHEESIHTSEAIAVNWKGEKLNGFDGKWFL